jgi:hypothetical protein
MMGASGFLVDRATWAIWLASRSRRNSDLENLPDGTGGPATWRCPIWGSDLGVAYLERDPFRE